MYPDDDNIPMESSEVVYTYDSEDEYLSLGNFSASPCSTSESELSNTFIDEFITGHYQGWDEKHNRWLGRWVSDGQMKTLLYSMQAFRFLDLQTFLLMPAADLKLEIFAGGTRMLDDFLADVEFDIVRNDRRFPEGAYHFLDEVKWMKSINGLYHALNHVQQPNADLLRFYYLWKEAIVPAITIYLPEKVTREKFESSNDLSWQRPTFESFASDSDESDLEDLRLDSPLEPVAVPPIPSGEEKKDCPPSPKLVAISPIPLDEGKSDCLLPEATLNNTSNSRTLPDEDADVPLDA